MKQLGFGLFIVAFIAALGSMVWAIFQEAEQTPWIVILIIGALLLGTVLLLLQAVSDRMKQKKKENYEEIDN